MNLHAPDVAVKDAKQALTYLKEGNKRFTSDQTMPRTTNKKDLEITSKGQKPFAAILSCADSRTAPEIYFDQKVGDLFVCRNAGNFADPVVIGSLEFATKHLGAPLVVVVGHSMCGAVHTSFDGVKGLSANLQAGLDAIREHLAGSKTKEEATEANIKAQVKKLKENPVIKEVNAEVVGAFYDIATGEVTWL